MLMELIMVRDKRATKLGKLFRERRLERRIK
jgi:hypothetical protein